MAVIMPSSTGRLCGLCSCSKYAISRSVTNDGTCSTSGGVQVGMGLPLRRFCAHPDTGYELTGVLNIIFAENGNFLTNPFFHFFTVQLADGLAVGRVEYEPLFQFVKVDHPFRFHIYALPYFFLFE